MDSGWSNRLLRLLGFPIRTSPDHRSVGNSPELFAATHVLHRLSAPRHPPHALSSLLTSISLTATGVPRGRTVTRWNSRSRPRPLLFAAGWKRETTLSKLNSVFLRMRFSKNRSASSDADELECGADRDRTDDPQLAKLVLSQLSYSPSTAVQQLRVGLGGLEPPTLRLSGVRSNHLSYRPVPTQGQRSDVGPRRSIHWIQRASSSPSQNQIANPSACAEATCFLRIC